jgi:type I restriction enzyme M protein
MANSASDARGSQGEIRRKIIETKAVDVIISTSSNFFFTVILPSTLWFYDKGKADTDRADKVLFIDARHIFRQVTRAHRDFTDEQLEFLANIVRLYRGEETENLLGSDELMKEHFADGEYKDIAGLCKVATLEEIEEHGFSLNPGRYVGVTERAEDDFIFAERLEELSEELEILNAEARELEMQIAENVTRILELPIASTATNS